MSDEKACREAFEAEFRHFCLDRDLDIWGREQYKHDHVQSVWHGWQAAWSRAAQTAVPGWISVEERLPELVLSENRCFSYSCRCLVFDEDIEMAYYEVVHTYPDKTGWHKPGHSHPLKEVTHWMPLPAAPNLDTAKKEGE